jgi:hypothetical protein
MLAQHLSLSHALEGYDHVILSTWLMSKAAGGAIHRAPAAWMTMLH